MELLLSFIIISVKYSYARDSVTLAVSSKACKVSRAMYTHVAMAMAMTMTMAMNGRQAVPRAKKTSPAFGSWPALLSQVFHIPRFNTFIFEVLPAQSFVRRMQHIL